MTKVADIDAAGVGSLVRPPREAALKELIKLAENNVEYIGEFVDYLRNGGKSRLPVERLGSNVNIGGV